jgi:hypothetical protein
MVFHKDRNRLFLFTSVLLLAFFLMPVLHYGQSVFPIKLNKKWGLMNQNGDLAKPPVYEAIGEFKRFGYAVMQREGKVGILNRKGEEIVPPFYQDIKILDSTLVAVVDEGKWKVINLKGKTILDNGYDKVKIISPGYITYSKLGRWGITSVDGEMICDPLYAEVSWLAESFFQVGQNGRLGILHESGQVILQPSFEEVRLEKEQIFFFRQEGKWGAVNCNGTLLFPPEYDSYHFLGPSFIKLRTGEGDYLFSFKAHKILDFSPFDNFYPLLDNLVLCKKDRRLGMLNAHGEQVLPVLYEEILSLSDTSFRVKKWNKWGVINRKNEILLPFEYDYISPYSNGLAILKNGDRLGAVNQNGKVVIPIEYEKIEIEKGRTKLYQSGKLDVVYLDEQGELKSEESFRRFFTVKVRKSNAGGSVSPEGEKKHYQLDEFEWFYSSYDDKWGLRKLQNGEIQINPSFDWIEVHEDLGFTLVGIEQFHYFEFNKTSFRTDWAFGLVNNEIGGLVTEVNMLDIRLSDFKEGFMHARFIQVNGMHGMINRSGKIILKDYSYIGPFKEGVARVAQKGKLSGTRDREENRNLLKLTDYFSGQLTNYLLQDYTSSDLRFSSEAYLLCEDCKWGYIDTAGIKLLGSVFSFAQDFVNGVGIVQQDEKWGAVGLSGKQIIPCSYDGVEFLENTGNQILRIYNHYEKYGLIDTAGQVAVRSMYDEIGSFREGRLAVKKNGLWGFANKNGNEIIPSRFRKVHSFSEGLACVQLGFEWGFIDKQGELVIDCQYPRAGNFSDGLAWVYTSEGYAYINQQGKTVIPPQFERAFDFEGGVARIVIDGKYGLIDTTGALVLKPSRYTLISPFDENGLSVVRFGSERIRYGLIDKNGKLITQEGYRKIDPFEEGRAAVKTNKGYGFIDLQGNLAIQDEFSWVSEFSEGRAAVWHDGYCGYIDFSGKEVIQAEYLKCLDFKSGKAVVYKNNQKTGLIDKEGNYIIEPQINRLLDFNYGRGLVREGEYRFYYVTEEARMSEGYFTRAGKFSSGIAVVEIKGKWGIINQQGIEIVPPKYESIDDFEDGYAKVRIKGFNGLINLEGECIVQPEYEYVSYAGAGLFRVEQGSKIGYCDSTGHWVWQLTE